MDLTSWRMQATERALRMPACVTLRTALLRSIGAMQENLCHQRVLLVYAAHTVISVKRTLARVGIARTLRYVRVGLPTSEHQLIEWTT